MSSFPRIRMGTRIKLYTTDKTAFSLGTVQERYSVHVFVILFDNKTIRYVSLEDTNTWDFVVEEDRNQLEKIPETHRKNIQLGESSLTVFPNRRVQTTPTEDSKDSDPSVAAMSSVSRENKVAEENESVSQDLPDFMKYRIDVAPGENFPHHNICSPKPVIRKLQQGKVSERDVRTCLRSLQRTSLNTTTVPSPKKKKHVTFGPNIMLNPDTEAVAAESEIHTPGEPAEKKKQDPVSHAAEGVDKSSVAEVNTTDPQDGGSQQGLKRQKHVEQSSTNLTKDCSEKKNFQQLRRSRRQRNIARVQNIVSPKHALRISRRRRRNAHGRVAKELDQSKNRSPPDPRLASKQKNHKGEKGNHELKGSISTALEEQSNISDLQRHCCREEEKAEEPVRKGKEKDKNVVEKEKKEEDDDECEEEEECLDEARPIDERDIKVRLSTFVEETATKNTQEIINILGSNQDLFNLFPKLNYTDFGNNHYSEQYDFMDEFINRTIPDATRCAKILSEPGQDITETVALFVEHHVRDAVERFNEVRILEAQRSIRSKREKAGEKQVDRTGTLASDESTRSSASG